MREVRLSETAVRGVLERNSELAFRCNLSEGRQVSADGVVFTALSENNRKVLAWANKCFSLRTKPEVR
jgi:hypothetical protein